MFRGIRRCLGDREMFKGVEEVRLGDGERYETL